MAALYPSLPLFPNLRCGVWYVRPPIEDSCYFKSTDGHNGNWSFSAIRLNLNLAEAAAAAGGCLVVDATKRGKVRRGRGCRRVACARQRQLEAAAPGQPPLSPPLLQRFPDAMSKTVPMWAAVMNRAVQQLRHGTAGAAPAAPGQSAEAAQPAAGGSGGEAAPAGAPAAVPAADERPWDCDVHLPAWVSANEANSIRQLLEGWVDRLLEVRLRFRVCVCVCVCVCVDSGGGWRGFG